MIYGWYIDDIDWIQYIDHITHDKHRRCEGVTPTGAKSDTSASIDISATMKDTSTIKHMQQMQNILLYHTFTLPGPLDSKMRRIVQLFNAQTSRQRLRHFAFGL